MAWQRVPNEHSDAKHQTSPEDSAACRLIVEEDDAFGRPDALEDASRGGPRSLPRLALVLTPVALLLVGTVLFFRGTHRHPSALSGSLKGYAAELAWDDTMYLVDGRRVRNLGFYLNRIGMPYCLDKSLDHQVGFSKTSADTALWGKHVRGVDEGDGWVKVWMEPHRFYWLPKAVDGVEVLTPIGRAEKVWTQVECMGHYGKKVGDLACCGFERKIADERVICPADKPFCVDSPGNMWGECQKDKSLSTSVLSTSRQEVASSDSKEKAPDEKEKAPDSKEEAPDAKDSQEKEREASVIGVVMLLALLCALIAFFVVGCIVTARENASSTRALLPVAVNERARAKDVQVLLVAGALIDDEQLFSNTVEGFSAGDWITIGSKESKAIKVVNAKSLGVAKLRNTFMIGTPVRRATVQEIAAERALIEKEETKARLHAEQRAAAEAAAAAAAKAAAEEAARARDLEAARIYEEEKAQRKADEKLQCTRDLINQGQALHFETLPFKANSDELDKHELWDEELAHVAQALEGTQMLLVIRVTTELKSWKTRVKGHGMLEKLLQARAARVKQKLRDFSVPDEKVKVGAPVYQAKGHMLIIEPMNAQDAKKREAEAVRRMKKLAEIEEHIEEMGRLEIDVDFVKSKSSIEEENAEKLKKEVMHIKELLKDTRDTCVVTVTSTAKREKQKDDGTALERLLHNRAEVVKRILVGTGLRDDQVRIATPKAGHARACVILTMEGPDIT
mmetsp:Transcript_40306/g.110988  ORF Transcript_40306/g.110988 Transcript_40306/m.110988 type:complete len:736 (-) Transcript_40306:130-2337(-)